MNNYSLGIGMKQVTIHGYQYEMFNSLSTGLLNSFRTQLAVLFRELFTEDAAKKLTHDRLIEWMNSALGDVRLQRTVNNFIFQPMLNAPPLQVLVNEVLLTKEEEQIVNDGASFFIEALPWLMTQLEKSKPALTKPKNTRRKKTLQRT